MHALTRPRIAIAALLSLSLALAGIWKGGAAVIGRTYRRKYGYGLVDSIRAECWWRLEHLPWRYDGQVFAPLARFAYGKRKDAERKAVRL